MTSQPTRVSALTVHLHPLALLSASDYITRHTVRELEGGIAGALLGQQLGRVTTAEYAFECKTIRTSNGDELLDEDWFENRLQQYKEVHQQPPLEFVGWFSITSRNGPDEQQTLVHHQLLKYNDSAILLGLHPADDVENEALADKLPITVYEGEIEAGSKPPESGGKLSIGRPGIPKTRFLEVPYTVVTAEAEMIGVSAIVNEGTIANVTDSGSQATAKTEQGGTGKGKAVPKEEVKDTKTEGQSGAIDSIADEDLEFTAEEQSGKSSHLHPCPDTQSPFSPISD